MNSPPILVYFSGDWDVHWGYDLAFDPWPHGEKGEFRNSEEQGGTKLLAAVYGPRQAENRTRAEGQLSVDLQFAPFAGDFSKEEGESWGEAGGKLGEAGAVLRPELGGMGEISGQPGCPPEDIQLFQMFGSNMGLTSVRRRRSAWCSITPSCKAPLRR